MPHSSLDFQAAAASQTEDGRSQVAGALLVHAHHGVLLHHRDDKPGIAAPGKWALFGGHLEEGESPRAALVRELREELGIDVVTATPFVMLEGAYTRFFIFLVHLTAELGELVLGEGQGLGYFDPQEALTDLDLSNSARTVVAMFSSYADYLRSENRRPASRPAGT